MFSVKFFDLYFNVEVFNGKVLRSFFSKEKFYKKFKECELKRQVERYFSGEKVEFDFDYEIKVSKFTLLVLEEVRKIPYGEVRTYGEIANKLKTSPKAIGLALKRNPIPVLIPCHRVVAKDGLGGYSYGLDIKKKLLELELKIKIK